MARKVLVLALAAGWCAAAAGELTWRRRALRRPSRTGYLALVKVAHGGADASRRAVLVCEREAVELRTDGGRWQIAVAGQTVGQGALSASGTMRFFVKRTPERLMLGADDRWVYSQVVALSEDRPALRVGVSPGGVVVTFRLVPRQAVRFGDDFPDPEPTTGLWVPVRGRWALSSLSYASQSANPAELAAVFDDLDDAASQGRTRALSVGIGVRLDNWSPQVVMVAVDSPADRAGIKTGDQIHAINGTAVQTGAEATRLLRDATGETVQVTVSRNGTRRGFELARAEIVWGKARRQVPIPPSRPGRTALITVGAGTWTDFRFACAARTHGVGALGLVFAYLGPSDYHVFRWLGADAVPTGTGRFQLVRVRGGRDTVLAQKDGGFRPHDFYALSVAVEGDALGRVRARAAVDGAAVLEAADDAIVLGRIGLWAQQPGAVCFDDVFVGEDAPGKHAKQGSANPYQRYDRLMRAWADPRYSWQQDGEQRWWHLADFPGQVSLAVPLGAREGLELGIGGNAETGSPGYGLQVVEGGSTVRLSRADKAVAQGPLADGGRQLALHRAGRRIRATLDGKLVLEHDDPQPLAGSAVWVKGVRLAAVRVECPNVMEDYFNGAPTEWHVMSGQWDVMNRWICKPSWSFFGGRSDGLLAVWSKRRLDGDCFLDAHVGVMMFAYGRYENMRDVGLTICGDGANLASGYTAIVGADGNTTTALYRQGKLVASTRKAAARLPASYSMVDTDEIDSQHRGWYHVKLTRQGRHVRLHLRDRVVLAYEDPEPLPGGRAAIWSIRNGLLLARVRLAASRLGSPEPVLRACRTFADATLTNDCHDGQVRVAARDGTYEITNATCGGPFAVALRPRLFSVVEHPRLSFEVKLTPEAKVDLYLRCRGKLYRVALSGPDDGAAPAATLGRFEGGVQPDGKWHKVSFDLLAALRRRHPDDRLLLAWGPELASRATKGYLLAGFGGNGAGATYWLRNVALSDGEPIALSHEPAPK